MEREYCQTAFGRLVLTGWPHSAQTAKVVWQSGSRNRAGQKGCVSQSASLPRAAKTAPNSLPATPTLLGVADMAALPVSEARSASA